METKWPKLFPPLTEEQQRVSNDFMKYWHEQLAGNYRYSFIEKFNHQYPIKNSGDFVTTLEIGAGLGEHVHWERLNHTTRTNYHALELRENMAAEIKKRHPLVNVHVGDCQKTLPFTDNYFDRIIAIHVLEHLPDLPAAIKELYRVCNKERGKLLVVIPCEGGLAYTLARKISAERLFKKRYKMPYKWFIEREHVSKPLEIIKELSHYFDITNRAFFPFMIPSINLNLVIGLTLKPFNF
jgi:ubiquinone/menaquinone biosynthesis C-methylase UbiE